MNPFVQRDEAAVQSALMRARDLVRRGDHRSADAVYRDLLEHFPARPDVLLDAGRAGRRRDDAPERVTALFERAVAAAPTWPDALLWLAQMCAEGYGRGYPAAVGLYRRVIELDPTNVDAHLGWGMLRGSPGVYGDVRFSVEEFARATRVAPDRPDAWWNLGIALLERGDRPGARASITRALALYRQRSMDKRARAAQRVTDAIDRGEPLKALAYVDESPRWRWPDEAAAPAPPGAR